MWLEEANISNFTKQIKYYCYLHHVASERVVYLKKESKTAWNNIKTVNSRQRK
jgi:hypothetical protein